MTTTAAPPTGRAPDPRPARTRAAILDAIERLAASGAELTVAGIVAEAGLSRSSFYSQFKDLGDVAVQLITELYGDLMPENSGSNEPGARLEAVSNSIRSFLSELQARRYLYAAVFGNASTFSAQREVCHNIAEATLSTTRAAAPEGTDPEFAAHYLAAGLVASTVDWLSSDSPVALDEVHQQLLRMLPGWLTADAPAE